MRSWMGACRPTSRSCSPGVGDIPGDHYLRVDARDGAVGPAARARRMRRPSTIAVGRAVTIDTVSHEGMLEDQGSDPLAYFTGHGVDAASAVLDDAIAIAANLTRDPAVRRPARRDRPDLRRGRRSPATCCEITVERLAPRVPYGVISNRHGRGALAGELPRGD